MGTNHGYRSQFVQLSVVEKRVDCLSVKLKAVRTVLCISYLAKKKILLESNAVSFTPYILYTYNYMLCMNNKSTFTFSLANLPNPIAEVKGDNLDEVGSGIGNVNENGNPIDDEDNDDKINDHGDGSGDSVGNVDNPHVSNDNDQHDNTGVVSSPEGTVDNSNNQDDEKVDVSLPKLNDGMDDDNDAFLPSDELDENQSDHNSESNQSDRGNSDDSISSGAILAIVLSCLFVAAVILFVLGIVLWGYRRHHATFVVTQDYPRILVASGTATTTTTIPKSYMQFSRLTPKGYEALPVTDYVPVQPVIKKPVY